MMKPPNHHNGSGVSYSHSTASPPPLPHLNKNSSYMDDVPLSSPPSSSKPYLTITTTGGHHDLDQSGGGDGGGGGYDHVSSTSTTSSTRKRSSQEAGAVSHGPSGSRKRATTACSTCRSRKTRCDNVRPKCSYCAIKDAKCRYPNEPSAISTETELILEKLMTLEALMKAQGAPASPSSTQNPQILYPRSNSLESIPSPPATLSCGDVDSSAPSSIHLRSTPSSLNVPNYPRTTINSIFSWPIYSAYFFKHEYAVLAPALHPFYRQDLHSSGRSRNCSSLQTMAAKQTYANKITVSTELPHLRALIKRFMIEVHTKNPIFDAETLDQYAIEVAEHGLAWDTTSCLILLVCALGLIASPYHPDEDEDEFEDEMMMEEKIGVRGHHEFGFANYRAAPPSTAAATILADHDDGGDDGGDGEHNLEMARAYWAAAEKRLGLAMMEDGLVSVQVQLLAGMFHMYNMQPLSAWKMFNAACVSFQGFICTMNQIGPRDPREESLKQRLYWSALKCECEIRDEVPLPASGISQLDYPDNFPSPPAIVAKEEPTPNHFASGFPTFSPPTNRFPEPSSTFVSSTTSFSPTTRPHLRPRRLRQPLYTQQELHERSWFYYLTEIALRRLLNRIINTWDGPCDSSPSGGGGLPPGLSMAECIKTVEEFESQLHQWYTSLPPALSFAVNNVLLADELLQHIRSRFIRIHEILYRPFIYHAIHHALDPVTSPLDAQYKLLAEKGLWYMYLVTMNGSTRKHRHQGTFYACRAHAACCLTLLAAAITGAAVLCGEMPGVVKLELPADWMHGVDRTIALLAMWESALANLKGVRELLERVKGLAVDMGVGGVGVGERERMLEEAGVTAVGLVDDMV